VSCFNESSGFTGGGYVTTGGGSGGGGGGSTGGGSGSGRGRITYATWMDSGNMNEMYTEDGFSHHRRTYPDGSSSDFYHPDVSGIHGQNPDMIARRGFSLGIPRNGHINYDPDGNIVVKKDQRGNVTLPRYYDPDDIP
jgi:hypothetical protein